MHKSFKKKWYCGKKNLLLICLSAILVGYIIDKFWYPDEHSELERNFYELAQTMKSSTLDFNRAIKTVADLEPFETIVDIDDAIGKVEDAQRLFLRCYNDHDNMINFVKENKTALIEENLDFVINDFSDQNHGYFGQVYKAHRLSIKEYLEAYITSLEYFRDNYDFIINEKNPESENYMEMLEKL